MARDSGLPLDCSEMLGPHGDRSVDRSCSSSAAADVPCRNQRFQTMSCKPVTVALSLEITIGLDFADYTMLLLVFAVVRVSESVLIGWYLVLHVVKIFECMRNS